MVNLTQQTSGNLGPESWFSDLLVAALQSRFTGGILLNSSSGTTAVFFREGDPMHAGGAGFTEHYFGQILCELSFAYPPQVIETLQYQSSMDAQNRPLLGELLKERLELKDEQIEQAVQRQTVTRIHHLFSLNEGSWQAAGGENERIRNIGVAQDGWGCLLTGFTHHASAEELRGVSDQLLGKGVKLKGSPEQLYALMDLPPQLKKAIRLLEKPRKPDQLERLLKRKIARGLFRLLECLDLLETVPVAKAIAIPKASLVKPSGPASDTSQHPIPSGKPVKMTASAEAVAKAAPKPPQNPLVKEMLAFHDKMGDLNHFDIINVPQSAGAVELRKAFTDLAKKFHPDAFSGQGLTDEVAKKAREVSARINDAYSTLNNEELKAKYLALLSDTRIQGDARKAERLRDAELKCKMALVHIRKREYKKARELLKIAVDADPSSGTYKAHLAWSMFADPGFDRDKAYSEGYALILEALKSEHRDAVVHYYAGRILKERNQIKEALHHFKSALKLDRKYPEAEREVRLLEMRASKDKAAPEKKSGFARFFKK